MAEYDAQVYKLLSLLSRYLIDGDEGAIAGVVLPSGKSLVDVLGGDLYLDAGGNPDVDNLNEHLRAFLGQGTGVELVANESLVSRTFSRTGVARVHPNLGAAIALAATTVAYGYPSSYTEIVPVNIITVDFQIYGFNFLGDAAVDYQIDIATGAAASEVSQWEDTDDVQTAGTWGSFNLEVPIYVAANTRVAARIASEGVVADTGELKLRYRAGL